MTTTALGSQELTKYKVELERVESQLAELLRKIKSANDDTNVMRALKLYEYDDMLSDVTLLKNFVTWLTGEIEKLEAELSLQD